ncbi:MAG: AraC family transcriptional regulator [Polyangiaceae bacterium]|nr:AraC family transcriptional regulator [Polyangiaceae bacterium]
MDVLADVFSAMRIGGLLFANEEHRAPWDLRFKKAAKIGFHIVARGACWLRVRDGREPRLVDEGDLVLLPRGWSHSLHSSKNGHAKPTSKVTHLICGAYAFDEEASHPLLSLLPPVLHVRRGYDEIETLIALLAKEAAQSTPGSSAIASRLAEALLLYAFRGWMAEENEASAGWLGALHEPRIGRALALIHQLPARPWTLEGLAQDVGVSRASLARHFTSLVGEPPLTYLTNWRMTLAARALRDTNKAIAEIASEIGYESEFAFSKAFKRVRGVPPTEYRKRDVPPLERAAREG